MSYRVYIKNDYKPEIIRDGLLFRFQRIRYWLLLSLFPLAAILHGYFNEPETTFDSAIYPPRSTNPNPLDEISVNTLSEAPGNGEISPAPPDKTQDQAVSPLKNSLPSAAKRTDLSNWTDVKITNGDNLARIFRRLGLSPRDLYEIMTSVKQTSILKRLQPGQIISFRIHGGELQALRFEFDLTRTLLVTKKQDKFTSEITITELETRIKQTEGIINDSLFLSGQAAGLPDKLIMQLIDIYGWDIDFRLDIRKGDSFKVIYEEKYKHMEKVAEGPVLAAEFNNRDRKIRAARYEHDNGHVDYYTPEGTNLRKAFLRNPLNFSRISSHFNLRRKHPVLNRIRAHRGVDYAAATGTPIKATGDGTIQHIGNKGGYGKTIIVKHGGKYSTLYAHLSRYRKGMKRGRSVKQGQVIGYVGKTGLATGPHLHYEFRVNDRHQNPLTVSLPAAENVPTAELDSFRLQSSYLFALLDTSDGRLLAQYEAGNRL